MLGPSSPPLGSFNPQPGPPELPYLPYINSRPAEILMLWSFPIGTIAGTVVRIHVTFLLFLVWIGAAQWRGWVQVHDFSHARQRHKVERSQVRVLPLHG